MEKNRYYVLKETLIDTDHAHELAMDIMAAFEEAGVEAVAYDNLDRMVLAVPDSFPSAATNAVLKDLQLEVQDHWMSNGPNGRMLSVNLFYHDEEEVVSASVDEGLLLSALAGVDLMKQSDRMNAAITAFAGDNDFTFGYGPLNNDMSVQDIMREVVFWDADEAIMWSPEHWDLDRAMIRIEFTPLAENEDGSSFAVKVEGMQTEWLMPADLVTEENRGRLETLPCAPETVRKWASMMPFEMVITGPVPDFEDSPEP